MRAVTHCVVRVRVADTRPVDPSLVSALPPCKRVHVVTSHTQIPLRERLRIAAVSADPSTAYCANGAVGGGRIQYSSDDSVRVQYSSD